MPPVEDAIRAEVTEWIRGVLPTRWVQAVDHADWEAVREQRAYLDESAWWQSAYQAGYAAPGWPADRGGRGYPPALARIVFEVLARYRTPRTSNPIGMSLAAPAILTWGTDEQRARFLGPIARHEEIWCQLFSEPGAGSDLAGLATSAFADGMGNWRVNGQKIWSTLAHRAQFGLLLARTDPAKPKRDGITCFILPLSADGVTVRPIVQITGETDFNEVFMDDVAMPDDLRLGPVGEGWKVAHTILVNERVNDSGEGAALPGTVSGRSVEAIVAANSPVADPDLRNRLVDAWIEAMLVRATNSRVAANRKAGQPPGREGSVTKLLQAEHSRRLHDISIDLLGERGVGRDPDDEWARTVEWSYLRSKSKTIAGGTVEIMRNILAERILGLPRDPGPGPDVPWQDIPHG